MTHFFNLVVKLTLFTLLITGFLSINTKADIPDLIYDKTTQPISMDRGDQPFYVCFKYGNPTFEKDLPNTSIKISLEGEGIKLAEDEIYDLYYNTEGFSDFPICNNTYEGPSYKLTPEFIESGSAFLYGPQSAKDVEGAEGQTTGGTKTSILKAKRVGMIRVGLTFTEDARNGDKSDLIYEIGRIDQATKAESGEIVITPNEEYKEDEIPGKKIITLIIGEEVSCGTGMEVVNGQCEPICGESEVRGENGKCQSTIVTCEEEGEEIFNNECVKKCKDKEERNTRGTCVVKQKPKNDLISAVVTWFVFIVLVLIIISTVFKIKNKVKKKR